MQPSLRLHADGNLGFGVVSLTVRHLQHLFQARAHSIQINLKYVENLLGDTLPGIAEETHHKMF